MFPYGIEISGEISLLLNTCFQLSYENFERDHTSRPKMCEALGWLGATEMIDPAVRDT